MRWLPVLLLLVAVCCGDEVINEQKTMPLQEILRQFSQSHKPTVSQGKIISCGPEGAKMMGTWSPQPVLIGEGLHIEANFTAVADIDKVNGNVEIWEGPDWKGQVPFIQTPIQFDCNYVKTNYDPNLKCPIKKGDVLYAKHTLTEGNLPEGTFSARMKMKNEDNVEFLCFIAVLTFKQPY